MSRNKLIIRILGVMTAVIVTAGIIITGCRANKGKAVQEECEGRQLLVEMERESVAIIEKKIDDNFVTARGEEEDAAIEVNGEEQGNVEGNVGSKGDSLAGVSEEDKQDIYSKDYNAIFEGSIFMGDSITEGLFYMEVIDSSKVVAAMGASILRAKEDLSKVVALNPKKVILLYGMNDVILFEETSEWSSLECFKANYKELLETLKLQLPYAEIYVQSPLSVADASLNANSRLTNENLDRFRATVKEVSKEVDVNYVDINNIVEKNSDLRAEDGIHLKHEFYVEWMNYLDKYIKNQDRSG